MFTFLWKSKRKQKKIFIKPFFEFQNMEQQKPWKMFGPVGAGSKLDESSI